LISYIPLLMLLALGVFVLLAGAAAAGGTNRTIDDEAGDSVTGLSPQYLGTSTASWNYGPTCGCTVRPDASSCFNGSWHDATVHNGATVSVLLSFNGACVENRRRRIMLTWARLRHGDILLRHRSEHRCGRGHDGQPHVHPRRQTRRHVLPRPRLVQQHRIQRCPVLASRLGERGAPANRNGDPGTYSAVTHHLRLCDLHL
jgi:hypothetical protein